MKFVRISQLREDSVVQFGVGFDCIEAGLTRVVQINPAAKADARKYGAFSDHHALFVDCSCGRHLLEAQIDFAGDGDSLIGIYPEGTLTKRQITDKQHPLPNFHARVRKVAAHVGHPDNWVHLGRLVKLPGGEYRLGPAAVTRAAS